MYGVLLDDPVQHVFHASRLEYVTDESLITASSLFKSYEKVYVVSSDLTKFVMNVLKNMLNRSDLIGKTWASVYVEEFVSLLKHIYPDDMKVNSIIDFFEHYHYYILKSTMTKKEYLDLIVDDNLLIQKLRMSKNEDYVLIYDLYNCVNWMALNLYLKK